jgi:hypothetical protein
MKTWIVILTLIGFSGSTIASSVDLAKKTQHPEKSKSAPKKQQHGGIIA